MTPAICILPPAWQDAVRQAARMHGVSIESLVGEAWICATSGKTIDFFQSRVRRELHAPASAARLAEAATVWASFYETPALPGEEAEPEMRAPLSTGEIAARDRVTIRAVQIRRKKWIEKQKVALASGQLDLFGVGGAR